MIGRPLDLSILLNLFERDCLGFSLRSGFHAGLGDALLGRQLKSVFLSADLLHALVVGIAEGVLSSKVFYETLHSNKNKIIFII